MKRGTEGRGPWQTRGCMILCVAAMLGGCGARSGEAPRDATGDELAVSTVEVSIPRGIVDTLPEAVLKEILFGYSLEECVEILGRPEDDFESVYERGQGEFGEPSLTVWRIWRFSDGSELRLGFISGELRDKKYEPAVEEPGEG